MGIKIPTYEDRLSPEGFQNIRATTPDMTVNTANTKGLQVFGDAVSTYGSTQYHLERQRSNADNSTAAMADLAAVQNQVQKDIYDGVDKMGVGATLAGEDGQPVPFGQAMQAQVKARYDAVAEKYANATPEVKQFVARQIITSQASWASEINGQAEKGAVVERIKQYDKGVQDLSTAALANPEKALSLIEQNKLATAQLGISPDARYAKLLQSQELILNAALTTLRNNPGTNAALKQSLEERLGNFKEQPNPYTTTPGSQPGQAAGFGPAGTGVAASTDLGAIAQRIAGAEGDTKNPNSSANYKYQFVDDTFISQAKASFPELKGKSNAEILALRGTVYNGQPIEEKMGPDHIKANADALKLAGFEATGTNVYLAHFLGVGGAIKLLQADPNTPIEQLTSAKAREKNSTVLKPGMTAQNIINWAGNTINRAPSAPATGGQPGSPNVTTSPRQEVPPWIANIVNQVQPAHVESALISSTAEQQRQAQTNKAAFDTAQADHIDKALQGIAIAQPLTLGDFMQHHPTDGVPLYNNYAANIQAGEVIAGMKTMPVDKVQGVIDSYKPNPDAPGFAAAQTRQNAIIGAYQKVEQARQADPIQYAIDNKIGGAKPINFNSPQDMAQELKNRAGLARTMADSFRTDGTSLLTSNETASLKKGLSTMTTQQTLNYLDVLKSSVSDPRQYLGVLQKIAPDQPVVALAGVLMSKDGSVTNSHFLGGSETLSSRDVAQRLVEGSKLLYPSAEAAAQDGKGKIFPMPPAKEFDVDFNSAVGKAFQNDPTAYHTVYQATRAYIAATMSRQGDYSGVLPSNAVTDAVNAVTGGISGRYNVLRPWGMEDGRFNNTVIQKFGQAMVAEGMDKSGLNVPSMIKLQPKGDSTYLVTSGAGVPLIGYKTQQPIVLDLTDKSAFVRPPIDAPAPPAPAAPPVLPGKTPVAAPQQTKIGAR